MLSSLLSIPIPDMNALVQEPWWQAMMACPQDPVHHAEGNVAMHTHMVLDALGTDPRVGDLSAIDRSILEWAALLHDVGKPDTTREVDGQITSRGHSRRGAILARRIMWQRGLPFAFRERVCRLVRFHMRPSFILEHLDPNREMIRLSTLVDIHLLAILARADVRGRISSDRETTEAKIDLFEDLAHELGVWTQPWAFSNPTSRVEFFRRPDRSPHYAAHDESWGEVIVMSGLPGSGKSTWLRNMRPDLPVISLDMVRKGSGSRPGRDGWHGDQRSTGESSCISARPHAVCLGCHEPGG